MTATRRGVAHAPIGPAQSSGANRVLNPSPRDEREAVNDGRAEVIILVRLDGHVAWRVTPAGVDPSGRLTAALRQVLSLA